MSGVIYFYTQPLDLAKLYPCGWCNGTGSIVCECRGGKWASMANNYAKRTGNWKPLISPVFDCRDCSGVKSERFSCGACEGTGDLGVQAEELALERKRTAARLRAFAGELDAFMGVAKSRSANAGGHGYAKFIPLVWKEQFLKWANELEQPVDKWNRKNWSQRVKRNL